MHVIPRSWAVRIACMLLAAGALEAQQPTFRTGVELVRLDVTVEDGNGAPIADLAPDDFDVRIEGVAAPVRSLRLLDLSAAPGPRTGGLGHGVRLLPLTSVSPATGLTAALEVYATDPEAPAADVEFALRGADGANRAVRRVTAAALAPGRARASATFELDRLTSGRYVVVATVLSGRTPMGPVQAYRRHHDPPSGPAILLTSRHGAGRPLAGLDGAGRRAKRPLAGPGPCATLAALPPPCWRFP